MFGQHEMLNRITARELAEICAASGLDLLDADLRRTHHRPGAHLLHSYTSDALLVEELTFVHRSHRGPGPGRLDRWRLRPSPLHRLRSIGGRARRAIFGAISARSAGTRPTAGGQTLPPAAPLS